MPTQKINSLEEAYQKLSDIEIEDDSNKDGIPLAIINVRGIHRLFITMVSEWDFYKILVPLRDKILNYYANRVANSPSEIDVKRLSEKIKNIAEEIGKLKTQKDIQEKSDTLAYLFEDEIIRMEFFKDLKKLNIIRWYVSWKRWQKHILPHHTMAIFLSLWAFNFDGFKKKTQILLQKMLSISQNTNYPSPIELTSYTDFDSFKKVLDKANERVNLLLANSKN